MTVDFCELASDTWDLGPGTWGLGSEILLLLETELGRNWSFLILNILFIELIKNTYTRSFFNANDIPFLLRLIRLIISPALRVMTCRFPNLKWSASSLLRLDRDLFKMFSLTSLVLYTY